MLICHNGTSTPANEKGESIVSVNLQRCSSFIYHLQVTCYAVGAVEAIATIEAIRHKSMYRKLLVQKNCLTSKLNVKLAKVKKLILSNAISNTFRFGGHNVLAFKLEA